MEPEGLVSERGFLEATLLRHFDVLYDPLFDELLASHYPKGVCFEVNGRPLPREASTEDRAILAVRMGRKRKPALVGVLSRTPTPIADDRTGVAVATLGKTIRSGREWLRLSPADANRIHGLFEVPGLAESLTLNKSDFLRTGPRDATYLAFRKATRRLFLPAHSLGRLARRERRGGAPAYRSGCPWGTAAAVASLALWR